MTEQQCAEGFTIRDLAESDAADLLHFYENLPESVTWFFRPWESPDLSLMQRLLAETAGGKHIMLALMNPAGDIAGHGFILNIDGDEPVFGIGLAEHAQGRGRGRAVMEATMAEARARNLPLVTLTVLKENVRGRSLYESLGFLETGECTFRSENDSLSMEWRAEA